MAEFLQNFHFLYPYTLIISLLLMVLLFLSYKKDFFFNKLNINKLKNFASPENLRILVKTNFKQNTKLINFLIFAFLILLTLAIAAPRWNYDEIKTYSYNKNIVILLDASSSMSVTDIKPSRFTRAKQEIYDILAKFPQYRIGIIAFAKIPHIIAPLTIDHKYIEENIKALNPDNFTLQGSNINDALKLTLNYFQNVSGNDKYILLISDGDFTTNLQPQIIKKIKQQKLKLIIYAIGSKKGAPVFKDGSIIEYQGKKIISKLNLKNLQNLGKEFSSPIININYNDTDLQQLTNFINKNQELTKSKSTIKQWQERFYIFLIPAMLIFLYFCKKNIFLVITILCILLPQKPTMADTPINGIPTSGVPTSRSAMNNYSPKQQIKLDAELKPESKGAYKTYVTDGRMDDNSDGPPTSGASADGSPTSGAFKNAINNYLPKQQIKLDAELKPESKGAYKTYVTDGRMDNNSDGSFNTAAWGEWLFLNQAQQAQKYFNNKQYQQAQDNYQKPYNKGVAAYRNEDYKTAIENFKKLPETDLKAQFNLANSYFQMKQYQQAIDNYENILKQQKDHKEAQHNLEIAKKMLKKSRSDKSQSQKSQNDKSQKQNKQQQEEQSQSNQSQDNREQNKQKQQNSQKQDKPQDKNSQSNKSQSNKSRSNKSQSDKPQGNNPDQTLFNLIETKAGELIKKKIKQQELQNDKSHSNKSRSNKNQTNQFYNDKPW